MKWSDEKLAALSVHERATLYANARAKGTDEAKAIMARIEQLGLPFSDASCVTMDDPITAVIQEVVFSKEGKQAAITASENGLPALAGIDPLLNQRLTVDYGPHNMTTHTAGAIVAEMMRSLGYREAGAGPLPSGCVAKTAMKWRK